MQAVGCGEREEIMKQLTEILERTANRRAFLKNSMVAGAVATVGAGILGSGLPAEILRFFDSSRQPN
jgi:hypothetical protein